MSNTLHLYYLQEMGIETWQIRQAPTFQAPTIKLMIIGDAPFAANPNDLFAGKAGGLLSKMLNTIGLTAEDVCFLPTSTLNFTKELLQRVQTNPPHMLLAIGNIKSLNTARGNVCDYQGTPLLEIYHPRDLLIQPANKKNAYQDLLCVQKLLAKI